MVIPTYILLRLAFLYNKNKVQTKQSTNSNPLKNNTDQIESNGTGKSLKARTDYFDIQMDKHHNTLSDAEAFAELVIKSIEIKNLVIS